MFERDGSDRGMALLCSAGDATFAFWMAVNHNKTAEFTGKDFTRPAGKVAFVNNQRHTFVARVRRTGATFLLDGAPVADAPAAQLAAWRLEGALRRPRTLGLVTNCNYTFHSITLTDVTAAATPPTR